MTTYPKPTKVIVPRESANCWNPETHLITCKADGEFLAYHTKDAVIACEFVTEKSGGFLTNRQKKLLNLHPHGFLMAFDLISIQGEDAREWPLATRWSKMINLTIKNAPSMYLIEQIEHSDSDTEQFIARMFLEGGEGVVAKRWDSLYSEPMECCKVLQTFRCVVTSIGGSQSVGIAEEAPMSLIDRGNVTLRGGKVDRVRIGSLLKISAMGLTDSGKLREPRLDADSPGSWLIQY